MLPSHEPHSNRSNRGNHRRTVGDYIPAEHRTQWPILVEPLANEPIDSWLARLSYRYGLTPRKILTALALIHRFA